MANLSHEQQPMYLILTYSLKDIFKVIKSIIEYLGNLILYLNNDVLCTSDLTLICHLTKIRRNVTFVFLNKNSTKLARSHKSDASLSIRTNSGIVRKCHLRHVFCVIYGRLDGYFMERLSKHKEQKI